MPIFQVRDQNGQIIDIPLFMGPEGKPGADGKSAFEIAKEKGFVGTEEAWLLTLRGSNGKDGADGKDYVLTEQDKQEIANMILVPECSGSVTTAEQETAMLGEELATNQGWTTEGWSGSFETGFTHVSGNTSPLIYTMPVATGTKLYQVSFDCSKAIDSMALFVTVGGSEQFDLYGQVPTSFGIRSVADGNLEFIPATNFTGTISNISIREVIDTYEGIRQVKDSNGDVVFEMRATDNSKNNIFVGAESGETNTSGYGNASLGYKALKNNTSGFWNSAIGYETLKENTTGSRNIGIGYGSLKENVSGNRNIGIGTYSLIHNKTGGWNIAIGADSQDHNESGNKNVAVGFQTLYSNKNGSNNIAIGNQAMSNCGDADTNIAIGDAALRKCEGAYNVAVGKSSLYNNDKGTSNVGIGLNTLYRSTGNSNTAIGNSAGRHLVSGNNNVAIGATAGQGTTAYDNATDNVFIGTGAGGGTGNGASYNVMIGKNAGAKNATGTNNVLIGANVDTDNVGDSYRLNIGGLLKGFLGNKKYLSVDGNLDLSKLPTEDPSIDGYVWNDNGVLRVSGAAGGSYATEDFVNEQIGDINISWNDLTDKPFDYIEGFETQHQLDGSGEIELNIDSKYIGANLYIEYSGDDAYESQIYSLTIGSTELSSSWFKVDKIPWEMTIKSIDTNSAGVKYVFAVPSYSTGVVKFTKEETVKTLDDQYISENIARVEWVEEQIGDINTILATLSNGGVE